MAMEIYPASDFTDGTEGSSGGGGGIVSLVATAPLTFDALTGTLAVMPAGAGSSGVVTTGMQTFAGAKAFSSAVSCAVAPSDSAHLANKGYIDGLISMGVHWLANVNKIHNFSTGDPTGLADGKRYIASISSGEFVANHIYTYILADDSYTDYSPAEGNAVYVEDDDSATFANQCIIYNGTAWVSIGSSINHQSLIGAGTLTHATIDSYLNQALLTTSSPNFQRLNMIWGTDGANVETPYIRYGTPGAGYTRNTVEHCFTYNSATGTANHGSIRMYGCNPSIEFYDGSVRIPCSTASTSAGAGALRVIGGAYVGGAIYGNGGGTVSLNTTTGPVFNVQQLYPTSETAINDPTEVLRLTRPGTASQSNNAYAQFLLDRYATGSLYANTHLTIRLAGGLSFTPPTDVMGMYADGRVVCLGTTASTSTTTGALTVPNGGLGVGGEIWCGSAIHHRGLYPGNPAGAWIDDSYGNLHLGSDGSGSCFVIASLAGSQVFKVFPNNDSYCLQITRNIASTSTTTGSIVATGGLGVGGAIWAGGAINGTGTCGMNLAVASSKALAGSYANFSTPAGYIGFVIERIHSTGSQRWDTYIDDANALRFHNNTGAISPLILATTGAATFSNRVTSTNMTCLTAPSAATDVVRLGDIDGWSPSGALHVTDDTETESTSTGSITTLGGVGIAKNLRVAGIVYSGGVESATLSSAFHYAIREIDPGETTTHFAFGSSMTSDRCGMLTFGISDAATNPGSIGLAILGHPTSGFQISQNGILIPATIACNDLLSGCLVALGGVAIAGTLRVGTGIVTSNSVSCGSLSASTITASTSISAPSIASTGAITASTTITATGALSGSNLKQIASFAKTWSNGGGTQTLYLEIVGDMVHLYSRFPSTGADSTASSYTSVGSLLDTPYTAYRPTVTQYFPARLSYDGMLVIGTFMMTPTGELRLGVDTINVGGLHQVATGGCYSNIASGKTIVVQNFDIYWHI